MNHTWGKKIEGGWFNEADHSYRDEGGVPVISCTRVFDVLGMVSLDNIAKEVLQYKKQYGTALHRCMQFLVQKDLDWDTVDERLVEPLTGIESFLWGVEFQPQAAEESKVVCVNGMKFGMTRDLVGTLMYAGRRMHAVLDLKTGAVFSSTWRWQIGAYSEENLALGLVMRVDPAGRVFPHWIDRPWEAKREFAILLAAATLKVNAGMASLVK